MALLALPTAGKTVRKRFMLNAADRVADQFKHFVGGEHLRLHMELVLELVVVDARVAGGEDQHAALRRFEGEGLGDASAFDAEGLRGQLDRGGGDGKFNDAVFDPEGAEVSASFLYGHGLPLKT